MSNNRPTAPDPFDIINFFEGVTGEMGSFISGPTPSNGIAAAMQQRMRDQCDAWSNWPAWGQALTGPSRFTMDNMCDPWLQSQGSGGPTEQPPPFTGVQCDCARYRVRAQGTFTDTFGNTNRPYTFPSQFIRGPLSSSTVELGPGGLQDLRWTYQCKGSDPSQYPACGAVQTFSRTTSTTSPPAAVTSMEIFVVDAPDGDDCGDPPGEIGPNPNPRPDPGLDPTDEPFDDPTGQPLLPMPPITNPLGDPIQLPNIPIPKFGQKTYPGSGTEDVASDPGTAGPASDTGLGESTEGEADPGDELVSVLVEVLSAPQRPRSLNLGGRTYYIGAGFVLIGSEDGLEIQREADYLFSGQMFYAERSSTHWAVSAQPGYNLRVTPYYREIPT